MIIEREKFKEFLELQKLSLKSIKDYLYWFDVLLDQGEFSQDSVNLFLRGRRNSVPTRALVKKVIEFTKAYEITIPQFKGRKKVVLPNTLTQEQVIEIARVMNNENDKLMVLLAYYCGLRACELIKIGPRDFNWSLWDLDQSKMGELKVTGKGNKERIVIVMPELMERFRHYINEHKYANIEENKPLFASNCGTNYSGYMSLYRKLRKASLKSLGFYTRPHILRHSIARRMREKGMDLLDIKDHLGHASVSSTEIYAQMDKETLKKKFYELVLDTQGQENGAQEPLNQEKQPILSEEQHTSEI